MKKNLKTFFVSLVVLVIASLVFVACQKLDETEDADEGIRAVVTRAWTFANSATGLVDYDASGSTSVTKDVTYTDGMTLLGSQASFRWYPTKTTTGFSNGCIQANNATATGKYLVSITNVQGPFTIKLNYTDTGSGNSGRYPCIYVNGTWKVDGGKTNGMSAITATYNYTGTDKVTVQLGVGGGGGIRLYDVIIDSTTTTAAVAVTGVSVSGGGSLAVGSTKALTVTITPSNATNKSVTWSSSDTSIATVDSSGTVKGVKAGSATITAKAADGSNKTGTASMTITAATSSTVAVTGVSVSGGGSVTVGSTRALTATITPSNATNKSVTWSSSDTAIATVDSSGTVKGVKAGSATITAKAADGSGKSGTASITVTAATSSSSTTKTSDRGGQTVAQLASAFDSTASTCKVSAIDNLSSFSATYLNDYIRGVDISSIIEVENAGGKFYDNDRYRVTDVLEILSYYGINWVRIRLWNNPYTSAGKAYGGGTNDYTKAVAIAKRAKKWGLKVMLDIHYSDFWTHPGQQAVPKAWKDSASKVDTLATTLKNYTKQVLSDMYSAGAMPDIVQVGNETVDGFCGFKDSASDKPNEKKLLAAGLAGVREASKQYNYPIRTMLHATGGMETVKWYYGVMKSLDFDILGLSFYPQYHGNLSSFKSGLQSLADTFKKPICVAEYSVSYTSQWGDPHGDNNYGDSNSNVKTFVNSGQTDRTIQGQASVIRNLNNAIMNNTVSGGTRYGIGSFWWEPAWLPLNNTAWAFAESSEWYKAKLPGYDSGAVNSPGSNTKVTWANQAFFSFTGTALPSLNAFLQMMGKSARPAS